jgi:lysophospholipase L1-like esterase
MKLLFLGDSITQGVGASVYENCYVSLVGQMLNCEVVNYGVSGTRIGRQEFITHNATVWNYDFRLRAQIMGEQADKVFVFGGTNDYGHGRLILGNVEDRKPNTFCYELRLLIEALVEKYGKEKLCFILPLHRFDEEGVPCKGNGDEMGATLSEYVNAMRSIIKEYGIDILDLFENGIPKPIVNTGDEYTVDGVHPNDSGYQFIAKKICEYISKNEAEDENH